MEDDVALDVHAAEGCGLRDGPLHASPPVGATEKFSAARQKVVVALLLREAASEWTLPVMWTRSGEEPRPRTSV